MWPENSNVILLSRHKKCLPGWGWMSILLQILFPILSSQLLWKASKYSHESLNLLTGKEHLFVLQFGSRVAAEILPRAKCEVNLSVSFRMSTWGISKEGKRFLYDQWYLSGQWGKVYNEEKRGLPPNTALYLTTFLSNSWSLPSAYLPHKKAA